MIFKKKRLDCYTTSLYPDGTTLLITKVVIYILSTCKIRKLDFPQCSQNLLGIVEYGVRKFINPISINFDFAHVIGYIVINIGNIGNVT